MDVLYNMQNNAGVKISYDLKFYVCLQTWLPLRFYLEKNWSVIITRHSKIKKEINDTETIIYHSKKKYLTLIKIFGLLNLK